MVGERLKKRIEHLLQQPGEELGRWARIVRFQIELWRFCIRRLKQHDVMTMGAALSFRSIFALIPILVLGLLVAKALGVLEDRETSLREFLEASGFAQISLVQEEGAVPPPAAAEAGVTATNESGEPAEQVTVVNVADEIEKVVANVERRLTFARIGPVGGLVLIWTAVGLLANIEECLNRIFGAGRRRSLLRRLLLYWSAMTLGPILLAAAIYLGRQASQSFAWVPGLSTLMNVLGGLGPLIVGIIVLAVLYRMLPNTTVRFQSAVMGATIAVLLWLVAKWAFALYVNRLVLQGNLYGVIGVLPLFMLWVYYIWLIFLFGAELAHTAVNLSQMELAERAAETIVGPTDVLAATLAVAQRYEAGHGPAPLEDIIAQVNLPGATVQHLLDQLDQAGLVCPLEDAASVVYVPARPAEHLAVTSILAVTDPRSRPDHETAFGPEIAPAITRLHQRRQQAFGALTLADLLMTDTGT